MTPAAASLATSVIIHSKALDYSPLVSTAANLVYLFQRCVVSFWIDRLIVGEGSSNPNASKIFTPIYCAYLRHKSILRMVTLLIPVLGNIAIALFDRWSGGEEANRFLAAIVKNERIKWTPLVQGSRDLAFLAVAREGFLFHAVAEPLKKDAELALTAFEQLQQETVINCCDPSLWGNPNFVLSLLKLDRQKHYSSLVHIIFGKIHDNLKKDKDFVLRAMKETKTCRLTEKYDDLTCFFDQSLLQDPHFALQASRHASDASPVLQKTPSLWKNEGFVWGMIKQNPQFFCCADESFRDNVPFLEKALQETNYSNEIPAFLGSEATKNKNFMKKLIPQRPDYIYKLDFSLRHDSQFMLDLFEATNGDEAVIRYVFRSTWTSATAEAFNAKVQVIRERYPKQAPTPGSASAAAASHA